MSVFVSTRCHGNLIIITDSPDQTVCSNLGRRKREEEGSGPQGTNKQSETLKNKEKKLDNKFYSEVFSAQ